MQTVAYYENIVIEKYDVFRKKKYEHYLFFLFDGYRSFKLIITEQ